MIKTKTKKNEKDNKKEEENPMKSLQNQILEIMTDNKENTNKIEDEIKSMLNNINNYDKKDIIDMVKKSLNQLFSMMETKDNKKNNR